MLCGSDILRGVGILDFELVMGILKDFQLHDGAALVIYLLLEKLYIVLQVLDAHHSLSSFGYLCSYIYKARAGMILNCYPASAILQRKSRPETKGGSAAIAV